MPFKLQSRLQARGHYFLLFPIQLVQVKKKGCKAYHMELEQNVVLFSLFAVCNSSNDSGNYSDEICPTYHRSSK